MHSSDKWTIAGSVAVVAVVSAIIIGFQLYEWEKRCRSIEYWGKATQTISRQDALFYEARCQDITKFEVQKSPH